MGRDKKTSGFSLKDQLFNLDRVEYLAGLFRQADGDFDASGFIRDTMKRLKKLELKERIVWIAATLERYLDDDYRVAASQICRALPPPLDPSKTDNDFGDFIFAPLGEYVVRNGVEKEYFNLSLRTLKALTQRFSMEDAIRAFINGHPGPTLMELEKWSTHQNYHVRRLVSEGTRPMLPWSKRLSIQLTTPMIFLDTLHSDSTRYVTRSVANHLNDIAKSKPKLVVTTLKRWRNLAVQDPAELNWISKHALRTLVKQGDTAALRFLGYRPNPNIEVRDFSIHEAKIKLGSPIEFSFVVAAERAESLMVDYVIDFVKANGTLAPKVYKLKQLTINKGDSQTISKRHALHADATTYTLHPGIHRVTLQINGKSYGTQSFELT